MSELAKSSRDRMKDKARKLATADPHQRVDASGWTPPEALNADKQTGMRVLSKRAYKRGGKVHGEHEAQRADRKPRKDGGRAFADAYVNRDVKEANEEREGVKHDGGLKRGGRAHRDMGGAMPNAGVPTARFSNTPQNSMLARGAGIGLKRGGAAHGDEKEDKHLIKSMVKRDAIKAGKSHGGEVETHDDSCRCHKCGGGMAYADGGRAREVEVHHRACKCHKCSGGSVSDGALEGTRPEAGGRMARKDGGRTDHPGRGDSHWIEHADLKKGALHRELHVPESEKIPEKKLHKAEHSSNKMVAKRADLAATLDRLHRKHGGKTSGKGKMSVNIVIAPGGDKQAAPPMPMGGPPAMPPHPVMPPPMGGPGAGAAPPPMGGPSGMPAGPGAPPPGMMPPPMGRKRGGKVHMDAGSGGGLGRRQKIKDYGKESRPTPEHY